MPFTVESIERIEAGYYQVINRVYGYKDICVVDEFGMLVPTIQRHIDLAIYHLQQTH